MRMAGLMAVGVVLALAASAQATLCSECRKAGPFTKDIGECTVCKERGTASGQFKLCWRCADKLQQCEHCLKPHAAATQPATRPTTRPIEPAKDGAYREGRWEYRHTVSNPGTRSEGYHGVLMFDGKAVAEPKQINDHYVTPWGKLYWVGQPAVLFGGHGWMPKPKVSAPAGEALPDPAPSEH